MSLNKIIIIFVIVLILFAGAVFYQFNVGSLRQGTHALPKTDITIDNHTFHTEIAKTTTDQETGLSNRKSLPQDNGMVFVFDQSGYHAFWMRDMDFNLDMIFILNNEIVAIYDNLTPLKANENGPLYGPDIQSDRVLEINAGLAQKYSFKKGDSVKMNL